MTNNLIKCSNCGKEISKNAKSCPSCGAKPKGTHPFTVLMAIIGVFWLIGYAVSGTTGSNTSVTSPVSSPVPTSVSNTSSMAKNAIQDNWTIDSGESKMDGSKTIYIGTQAVNTIHYWLGSKTPTLVLRCKEKTTDVIFDTGTSAQPEYGSYDEYTVRVRFDDDKPIKYKWSGSTDNKALFASGAVGFAKKISKSKAIKIEFTPFNSSLQIAEFNVDGLSKHLPELAKTCGWKL